MPYRSFSVQSKDDLERQIQDKIKNEEEFFIPQSKATKAHGELVQD